MKLRMLHAAIALTALLLVLPAAGCKNEQKTASENTPLTRQDLEDVLGKKQGFSQEVMDAMKAEIAEETKGYFDDEPPIKIKKEQSATP